MASKEEEKYISKSNILYSNNKSFKFKILNNLR